MDAKEMEGRLRDFAIRIVSMCAALPAGRMSKIIEDQLLRSSFSAAANYRAACKAISKKAFVSKLSIAFEESDESLFWVEIILELSLLPLTRLEVLIQEAKELASILAAARKTAQLSLK
jgi:four helix bundle protein